MRTCTPVQAARPGRGRRKTADSLALRMVSAAGLIDEAKTRDLNAKVQPALFEATARRAGSRPLAIVIEAALAVRATRDDLGPWLAEEWGVLADFDLFMQIDPALTVLFHD